MEIELSNQLSVTWIITGHSGTAGNEGADHLAKEAATGQSIQILNLGIYKIPGKYLTNYFV